MRLLNFIVNAQQIYRDPCCNFDHIVAGTREYLRAHFTFSPEWQDCVIVAQFWRGKEEHAVLIEDGECVIPAEALVGHTFKVSVTGQSGDYRITTNKVLVRQEVSR